MEQKPDQLYQAVQATRPLLRNITTAVERGTTRLGITVGQRAILEGLSLFPDATAPVLSAELQLKRQYVARILKELMDARLAERHPTPGKARMWRYRLTPGGARIIATIRADETEKLQRFANEQSAEDLAAFYRVQLALTQYFANLSKET
jgi:DNA-binding MarR family transcriptional regulator